METNTPGANNKVGKICPYLGIPDDSSTSFSYPSGWNCCFHAKRVVSPKMEHQRNFCLDEEHINCLVFKRKDLAPLPVGLRASDSRLIRKKNVKWGILLPGILAIITIAIVVTGVFSKGQANLFHFFQANPTATIPPATATGTATQIPTIRLTITRIPIEALTSVAQTLSLELTMTMTPTTTYTATPTLTATPTTTSTPTITPTQTATSTATSEPSPYELDKPIGTDYQFIIHKAQSGENLNQYATIYKTSVEAILRVNYALIIPLWVDALVVIPFEFTKVTQMPYFQPYKVTTDGITVETLGRELATDLNDFIYYNGLSRGERLSFGDWLLVPRNQSAN
ncbi:MAG: hypothetical protein Q7J07_01175 [Pelolinea sp.]|nr:hypothetical protein [Pelolinea sp.]